MEAEFYLQLWTKRLSKEEKEHLRRVAEDLLLVDPKSDLGSVGRWYRRCIMSSAENGHRVVNNPWTTEVDGPEMGPSYVPISGEHEWEGAMTGIFKRMKNQQAGSFRFWTEFIGSMVSIWCYHPDPRVKEWWRLRYQEFKDVVR